MKFTNKEISLCKQVAEKYRKDIEYGDWMIIEGDPHEVPALYVGQDFPVTKRTMLPLWTISDCLEFLRERCKDHVLLIHEEGLDDDEEWYLWFDEYKEAQQWDKGKTPLEACLKVVLAILGKKR